MECGEMRSPDAADIKLNGDSSLKQEVMLCSNQHSSAGPTPATQLNRSTLSPEQLVLAAHSLQAALASTKELQKNALPTTTLASSQLSSVAQLLQPCSLPLNTSPTSATTPLRQLMIPIATGTAGVQQLLALPVSLTTATSNQTQSQQVSFIQHNNQIVATNLRAHLHSLTGPMLTTVPATALPQQVLTALNSSCTDRKNGQIENSNTASPLATMLQQLAVANSHPAVMASLAAAIAGATGQMPLMSRATDTQRRPSTPQSNDRTPADSPTATNLSDSSLANGLPSGPLLPQNLSHLLPNTIGNTSDSTVDGVDLDEIREFAKQFKIRRLSLGLTQTQVGQALSAAEGPAYSQSAICRFEKLDITPKSAQKIKPVLEKWMTEAEEKFRSGSSRLSEFVGSEPSKKRKRRTSFTPSALEALNDFFERNTHPTGGEMTLLSDRLGYDREVVRVWFCNKRQALKNTIKKLKIERDSPRPIAPLTPICSTAVDSSSALPVFSAASLQSPVSSVSLPPVSVVADTVRRQSLEEAL